MRYRLLLSGWLLINFVTARGQDISAIKPDGTSVFLTSYAIRARYRESLEKEKLLVPRVMEKGSRLRLVLTSPNSVTTQKNYDSGGVVANETATDAHVAHIKIYGDNKHPSVLMVPVMP